MATPVFLAPTPILQFLNNSGQMNAGGSVLTQVGGVNYPTYQDSAGNTPLPNPIPLNSRGEISNSSGISSQLFLAQGVTYTFTQYDPLGNQINQASWMGSSAIQQNDYATGNLGAVRDTIAALRGLSHTAYTRAFITGYYAAGDGGGGPYWYDPTDTTSADNGGTIIVATDGGRWKLQYTTWVSIKQFGAKGDGVTNDTAPIQSALNTLVSLFCPDATYLVDTLYFPNSPSDTNPLGGKFIGSPNVIFLQATANTALFKKVQTAGRTYNWEIGPFCVKPKSGASSTVSAIFVSGFTGCKFNHIEGLSNGSTGFYAIFDIAASPYLAYANTFEDPTLVGTTGYTKCFHFENNGTGSGGNSNLNTINRPYIYNNTGMTTGIDCNNAYAITVNDPRIEANPGMLAFNMGPSTIVNGGSLEANGTDFSYTGANTPYSSMVIGTYLATAHNVDFGGTAFGNVWIGVNETGAATWINSPGQSNQKVQFISTANPAVPTLSQIFGTTGTIGSVSNSISYGFTQFTRRAALVVRMQFTPANTATVGVLVTPPAGWSVVRITAGVVDSGNGNPVVSAVTIDNKIYFTPGTTSIQFIDYTIELTK